MTKPLVRPWCAAIQVTALFLLFAGSAQAAQDKDFALEAYGYHLQDVELENGKAQYDVTRSGIKASYAPFHFSYNRLDYSWDDSEIAKLPFGNKVDKPWKALQSLEIGTTFQGKMNGNWSHGVEVAAFAAFEKDFGGYGGRVQAWAGYGFGPDLRLRFGGRAYIHQFQVVALPVLSLDYRWDKPDGFSANIGLPDAHLRYGFNKYLALRLFGEYEHDLYQLAEDSKVIKEGYLQREGIMTGLMLDITPVKDLCISAGIIRSLTYSMTTYDKDGENEKEYDNESSWGALVKVNYAF
jgi:hypothetical protein